MRELKECTAEVFRRSEKRIKARKRMRGRMLVLGISACLITVVVSAVFLPAMVSEKRAQNDADETVFSAGSDEKIETAGGDNAAETVETESERLAYTAVEIGREGLSDACEKVTDQAVVEALYGTVLSIFYDAADRVSADRSEEAEMFDPTAGGVTDEAPAVSAGKWGEYTIRFTAEGGKQAVFHLRGNTLIKADTMETVTVSDAQAAQLLAVFGLSE